jgi:hypothetical protein
MGGGLMKKIALLLIVAMSVSGFTQNKKGKKHDSTERGVRSFMEVFANLERDWTTAIQKHDVPTLDKMLALDFIVRNAVDPEHVMNRSDWLEKIAPSYKIESFSQSGMTVRVFPGDVALVSFVQWQTATVDKAEESGRFLVIDIWVADHVQQRWQLAQRYWAATPKQ